MTWLYYAIAAAVAWAAHVVCLKILGDKIPAALVTFSFYMFALTTTALILAFDKTRIDFQSLIVDWRIFAAVAVAGITIALTDFFFVKGFSFGAPMSVYPPLFTTVGLTLIALAGLVLFAESLTTIKLVGFACAVAGIFLMAQ